MTNNSGRPVVVGVDGSKDSIAALRWAEAYASASGGPLRIVTAWEWPVAYGYPVQLAACDPEKDARDIADKAAVDLAIPTDRIEKLVVEGAASRELVRYSTDAEVLVVGCHGHSAIGGLLLGSVSNYCLHHAACTVVVVR